ncbi:MAG: hypothetical protein RL326_1451 [Pseudomonadota bacterium]|jgi:hypothetical protein
MSDGLYSNSASLPDKLPVRGAQPLEPKAPGLIELAKQRLLDPQTIAERHSPGTWETLKREEREVTEALVKLPARIRELAERHDQVTCEHSAIEKHRIALERDYQRRSRTIASYLRRLVGSDPILEMLREGLTVSEKALIPRSLELATLDTELRQTRQRLDALPDPNLGIIRFSKEISRAPLSLDEKRELLRPEVLAALSLDEYMKVWARLNPYFVAHITRQGVRDHNAMFYHSAGMHEYHDGFWEITRNRRELRAPRAVNDRLDPTDRESVREFLRANRVFERPSKEEAKAFFNDLLHYSIATAPKYADKAAIHFSAQIVLNRHYGCETDNEIFIVFPSDVIASQYHFSFGGWEKDFTRKQSEDGWNDVFVWDQRDVQTTIPLDAGIVFLPSSTLVDPVTGSRYALSEPRVDGQPKYSPQRHVEFDRAFASWCADISLEGEFGKSLREHMIHIADPRVATTPEEANARYAREEEIISSLRSAIDKTLQGLTVPADIAVHMNEKLLTKSRDLAWQLSRSEETAAGAPTVAFNEWDTREMLAYLRPAIEPIPARKYWEARFEREPELRPRHIVYYEGDPTKAIERFLAQHEIIQGGDLVDFRASRQAELNHEERLLGFYEHFVADMSTDPRANRGLDELTRQGLELLDEWWAKRSEASEGRVGNG